MKFSRTIPIIMITFLSIMFYVYQTHIDKLSNNLNVLMYHSVNPAGPRDKTEVGVVIKPEQFEQQIKYLKDKGYNFVDQRNVIKDLEQKSISKPIWVTFDDGYDDNYLYAYPILKKYNIPATINIVVSKVSDKEGGRYLSWNDIKLMKSDNILVGSHSYNSHKYSETVQKMQQPILWDRLIFSNGQQETYKQFGQRVYNDFSIATRSIEKYAGYKTDVISYPYGKASRLAKQIAHEMGYKIQLGIEQGTNESTKNLQNIKRITARGNYSPNELEFKIRFYKGIEKIPF